MKFHKLFTTLIYILLPVMIFSQASDNRGSLLLKEHPDAIHRFENGQLINLKTLRECTNFLTNPDISQLRIFEDLTYKIPKRKKAFIRHIKHLSELLEFRFFSGKKITDADLEIFYELVLFEASLIQSAKSSNATVTRKDRIQLVKDSHRSKKIFQYEIPAPPHEIPTDINTPFWHQLNDTIKLHEQFDHLAKQKKIKARKKMVLIFDELSYSGSAPKVRALDLDFDNEWSLKWGDEVHTDVLGSRIFAALGYDVDHPYHYGKDKVTLVFDGLKSVNNFQSMRDSIYDFFKVDISPFISDYGMITEELVADQKKLGPYLGLNYVRFIECGLEARPDRVKRIGSFLPNELNNEMRRELRGSVLAHAFIDNWDTREMNTLLTTVHDGNYNYRISAVFSDLGTSLGVSVNSIPADFKVGLVNELSWEVASKKNNRVKLDHSVNALLKPYLKADYDDLKWMAIKIAGIDSLSLRMMINEAGWPEPIEELYFHKMASRRASIVSVFDIADMNPIWFDKNLTIEKDGKVIIKNGVLQIDYKHEKHPESFISKKGRMRNYGY